MTNQNSEFDYRQSSIKVSGKAPAPASHAELIHGDEVYFLGRGSVSEVAFPEDKNNNIERVATVKLSKGYIIEPEDAEQIIAEQKEAETGQGNIIAEIKRNLNANDEVDFDVS